MSTRSNPFEELERLFERMSRQYERASGRVGSDTPFAWWESEPRSMPVDLVERDDEFVVTVDLPGFDTSDVEVRLTDHTLHIETEREETAEGTDEEYIRRERHHESAQRSIRLPDEVDAEDVRARMNDGVLTLRLRKLPAEQGRTVEIE